jgi:hypothetical protein
MSGDLVAWTFEPVRVQEWTHDDQKARVEIDEYDLVEIPRALMAELLLAAGWVLAADRRLRPCP